MKHRIILMRHADAELKMHHQSDFERIISRKGIIELQSLRSTFYKHLNTVDCVFCSTSTRTYQTLEQIEAFLPFNVQVDLIPDLYHASKDQLWETIINIDDQRTNVLIISHNPGLSYFMEDIDKNHANVFPTSGMSVLVTNNPYRSITPYNLIIDEVIKPNHSLHR